MAAFLGMKCDFQGCDQHVSSDADFSTWWEIRNSSGYDIIIARMDEDNFKNPYGKYVCCIDHANKMISQLMSAMQQNATSSEREQETQ